MAGLKRTQRSGARTGATDTYYSEDDFSRGEYSRDNRHGTAHARPSVRPRFGTGARPAGPRRRASDGLLHWRLLALGACALILGTGGVVALRAMAPVAAPQAANGPVATPPAAQAAPALAAATSLPATSQTTTSLSTTAKPAATKPATASAALNGAAPSASTPGSAAPTAVPPNAGALPSAPPPARAHVDNTPPAIGGQAATARPPGAAAPVDPQASAAGHAQMATHVASILGAGTPAPAAADPVAIASAPPTADDLARPAFLEPLDGDEADLPAGAAEAAGDAMPLPTPRPADATAAPDADGARSARIRSAVTLRSGPRRSASAIGTLDEGTRVTLYSCKSWCEVSSGDKRGFVYKTAVAQ